jgi:non-heme chloroperoxidase
LAGKSIGEVADHFGAIIGKLEKRPVIIGHSTGGLLTEILAGRGLAAASVAISPAPSRGVLPLPFSSLRVASAALRNPANKYRAVPLTFDQFRYGFANYVDDDQARRMYEQFCVAAPGEPLFQAAAANLNPWTEAKFEATNPDRGPMLIIAGGKEHTVPVSVSKASFKREQDNPGTTEFVELADRGHGMVIDDNWQEVAETALKFVGRFVS